VEVFHRLIHHGIVKNQVRKFFHPSRFAAIPFPAAVDFSQSRFDSARHAACGGITPAKPGSAQAPLARRARNLRVFHRSVYHGIVKNLIVPLFALASAPEYNSSESKPC
jgi:hypothetical protein